MAKKNETTLKGLYRDLTNDQYHAVLEGDKAAYSSSQLKDALDDIEIFYKKYITKELKSKSISAFDVGTYYHTAILEPHILDEECVVFEGKVRRGKAWEEFQKEHEGKVIITLSDKEKADNLINATKDSPIAMDLLSRGEAEVSLFWDLMGVKCKVRADWLYLAPIDSDEDSYILDLKSTTGNTKNGHSIKGKISSYSYDLSAAFYLDMFNQYLEDKGLLKKYKPLKIFYWTFASKDMCNCKTYFASEKMLDIGRNKYKKALHTIKMYRDMEWEFPDFIEELEPQIFEEEWLNIDPEGMEVPKGSKFAKTEQLTSDDEGDIL